MQLNIKVVVCFRFTDKKNGGVLQLRPYAGRHGGRNDVEDNAYAIATKACIFMQVHLMFHRATRQVVRSIEGTGFFIKCPVHTGGRHF